jgi:hypothetical protein
MVLRHVNQRDPHNHPVHLLPLQWILNTNHPMVMSANDHLHQIGTEIRVIMIEEDRTRLLKEGVVAVVLELADQHETLIREI